jgi:hypothetical protein
MSSYIKKDVQFVEDDDGTQYPYLKKDAKYFWRKTDSGKYTIIQEIMVLLKNYISNIIVFSPTNDSNNLYTNKIRKPGIFKKISMEVLEEINDRQKKVMQISSIANDMEIMKSIFLKTADERMKSISNCINRDAARYLQLASQKHQDPSIRRAEEDKIRTMRDKSLRDLYKLCIKSHEKELKKNTSLSDVEMIAVEFSGHSPDLLIIFDDCASFFKEHQKEPLIMDMFYNSRHDGLTSIFSFQGDKDIPPNLRRAAHTAIFTTPACAMAHFSTSSNGYDRITKKKVEKAINRIFRQEGDLQCFRKLAYLRNETEKIQAILADKYDDFCMGGLWVRKFLQAIEPKSLASGSNKALIKEILSMTR